jgi:hypothetical protein
MLPAPATIAARPTRRSRPSWKPAVPPPPVTGAAVGNRVADWVGVAVGSRVEVGVAVVVCVTVGVADDDADALSEELAAELGESDTEPLVPALTLTDPVTEGENVGGVEVEEPPEQAESPTEASTVKVAQPMAVSRTLSAVRAMVARTFIAPSSYA